MKREKWKDIDDFPGYQVSDKGNVRTKRSAGIKKDFNDEYVNMNPQKNLKGYLQINLRKDNKYYKKTVHRLVLSTFKPIKNPDDFQIDHLDLNKENNCLSNLEWVTPKENIRRAIINGRTGYRFSKEDIKKGSEVRKKKIIAKNDNSRIRYNSLSEAAKDLDLKVGNISAVLNHKQNTTGKDRWRFEYDS